MRNRTLTLLVVFVCACAQMSATQYCQIATGHLNDANFGDAAGRILLSLEPTGNTDEYKLTVRANIEDDNTKQVDYLYVTGSNGVTINPNPSISDMEGSGVGSDELYVTFTCTSETADFTVMWSYPDWDGRYQCTVSDIVLSELETCNSTPAQIVYFINAAQWGGVRVVVQTWDESTENWVVSSRGEATLTTEQVNDYDIYAYTLPEGYDYYSLAFDDSQSTERSHTTTSTAWPEGNPYFCVNGMYDDGMGYALGDWYASLEEYMEAAANAQFRHLHIDDLYYNLNPDEQTAEVTYDMFGSSNNYSGLAGTVIPATVESESVTYSVTSIGEQAFAYCSALSSIDIPSTVTSIGKQAFGWCLGLTSITIPNSITNIEDEAFLICSSLMTIFVDAENQIYDSRENCNAIIETSTNTLILGCQNTIIPNGVTSLGENAFSSCNGLKSITIPSSVTTIGNNALSWCELLESITCFAATPPTSNQTVFEGIDFSIPVYVPMESIELYQAAEGWGSFTNIQAIKEQQEIINPVLIGDLYYNLDTENQTAEVTASPQGGNNYTGEVITIPASVEYYDVTYSVTRIGTTAFMDCSMTNISIPPSVTSLGESAFARCFYLTDISLPDNLVSIEDDAFFYCSGLKSIEIPVNVSNIGIRVFESCYGLTSIVVKNGNSVFDSRNNCNAIIETGSNKLIAGCQNTIIPSGVSSIEHSAFAGCINLTSITFPDGITSIGQSAFTNCTGLTSLTLPGGVTSIGSSAFFYCTGLTSITCHATTPPICSDGAFKDVNRSIPLYVPAQSIEAYQAADQWKEFNIQAIAGSNPQVKALMVTDVCQGEAMTTVTYATSDATTYQYCIVGKTALSEAIAVSESGSFSLDISAFAAGEYTLKFVANSDNYSSDTATATFAIHPLPTIAITSVSDQCYPAYTIEVNYTSTDASTVSYLVKSGGEVVSATDRVNAQSTGTFLFEATTLPAGSYTLEMTAQSPYGCESTLATASFNILAPAEHIEESITTCAGESFMWRGLALTEAGIYSDTVRNALGCDSAIYTLRLAVSIPIEYDAENVTICSGETYIWRDMELTEAGEYESTLVSIYGCDSIRFRLALTIIEPVEHETDYLTITLGDTITWRERQIVGTETGEFTYMDEVTSDQGCPTDIYTLQLTVEEKPEEQPTISIFGEEVVITDSTGVEMDQVDILGDSTMIYTPEDNTLTLDNVDLTVGEDVSTAISYTGSQPLIIVLCNFSVIYADTVISSTASIIITGDGQLSVEGTVPIFGLPTASITFNSVNMHARSVPSAQALRRRIRSGRMLDETGGPALSGFGNADFNKTTISPSGALYGPVNIPDGNGGLTATNALYIVNGNGEQEVLTEFYLTAEATDVETVRPNQPFDPTQPAYNILGLQVDASYRGIVIQNGKSFLLLGQ